MYEKRKYGKKVRYRVTDSSDNFAAKQAARLIREYGVGAQVDTWKGGYAVWADKKLTKRTKDAIVRKSLMKHPTEPKSGPKKFARSTIPKGLGKTSARFRTRLLKRGEETVLSATSRRDAESLAREIIWKEEGVGGTQPYAVIVEDSLGVEKGRFINFGKDNYIFEGCLTKLEGKTRPRKPKREIKSVAQIKREQAEKSKKSKKPKKWATGEKPRVLPASEFPRSPNVIMENREGTAKKFWGWQLWGEQSRGHHFVDIFWGRIDAKTFRMQTKSFDTKREKEDFISKKFKEKQAKGYQVTWTKGEGTRKYR
jgi:hypothetical protein